MFVILGYVVILGGVLGGFALAGRDLDEDLAGDHAGNLEQHVAAGIAVAATVLLLVFSNHTYDIRGTWEVSAEWDSGDSFLSIITFTGELESGTGSERLIPGVGVQLTGGDGTPDVTLGICWPPSEYGSSGQRDGGSRWRIL